MFPINQKVDAERVLATGKYQLPNCSSCEDVWVIRYLIDAGKEKEDIRKTWEEIFVSKSNRWSEVLDVDSFFDKVYLRATKTKLKEQKKIVFFQSEIDAINNTDIPMRAKEYMILFLAYFKGEGVKKLPSEEGNALRLNLNKLMRSSPYQNKTNIHWECIGAGLITETEMEFFNPKYGYNETRYYYSPTILKHHGIRVGEFSTLIDVPKIFDKLKCEVVCAQCGKKFEKKPKTQRNICEECWKKKESERVKKYRVTSKMEKYYNDIEK